MTQPAEAELVRYFTEVTRRADSVGVKLPIPEIALIGKQNCGKSSLLDGFVGRLFNYVANNTATRRPLRLALIHDPKCVNPRWEVEGAQVTETEMRERVSQVNRALGPANPDDAADCGRINPIPFNVSLTSAHVQNMIILDTPGLRTKGESLTDEIDACVSDIAKNPDVTIFAVLEASENLDAAHVLKIIEKHDPRWERTVLICNKFDKALIDCKSATDVTAWLKGKEGRRWFGTTLPILHDREHLKQHGPAEFDAWCKRSEADQKDILERLGPSLLPHVGISAARNYLHSLIIQKLRDAVPKISAAAAKYLASLHPEIAAAKAVALSCSPDALLKGALTVGSDLTLYIRDLVRGINTKEKVPAKYHFTLEDELQALANAGLNGRIPYADGLADIVSNRTFETCGGAQFDRLLTEVELFFRSVQFPKITASELDNLRAIGESSVRAPWSMVITKSLRGKLANDEDIYSERASGKVDEFSDASIFKSPFAAFVTRCKLICHNMFEVAGLGEGIRSFLAENPRVHDYFRHRYRVLIDLMCANLERQFVGYVRTCAESMRYMSRPEESDSRSSIVDRTSEAMVERVREEMLHQHKSAPWENLGSESQLASPDLLSRFQVNLEMHYKVIRDHLAVYFRHMFAVYVRNYLVQRQLRVELVAQIRDMNTDQFAAQFLPDMENHRRQSAARIAALERKQGEVDAIIRLSQQLNA